jgi:hypothetical protein
MKISNEIETISGVKVLLERFNDLNKNSFIKALINNNLLYFVDIFYLILAT